MTWERGRPSIAHSSIRRSMRRCVSTSPGTRRSASVSGASVLRPSWIRGPTLLTRGARCFREICAQSGIAASRQSPGCEVGCKHLKRRRLIPASGSARARQCVRLRTNFATVYAMMSRSTFILANGVSRSRSTMLFLKRLLVLISLVLFSAHVAFAHAAFAHGGLSNEHAAQMFNMAIKTSSAANAPFAASVAPAHCPAYSPGLAASGQPRGHDHSLCCCVATCGIHCGALFVVLQFEPRAPDLTLPSPLPEQRRDGLTHAPPVRPPIG